MPSPKLSKSVQLKLTPDQHAILHQLVVRLNSDLSDDHRLWSISSLIRDAVFNQATSLKFLLSQRN